MSSLNGNNFLRFVGGFTPLPYTITPLDVTATMFSTEDSIIVNPFATSSASNGIDTNSLQIFAILDSGGSDVLLSQECQWDGISALTIYRPANPSVTLFAIYFYFSDVIGNSSYPFAAKVVVTLSAISVAWRAHPLSVYCVFDSFGNNNGYQAWTQLELYNTGTGSVILPLQLKPNATSDPDYIAPVTNLIACPVATPSSSTYAPLYVSNFTDNGADTNPNDWIYITNIYLYNATAGPGGTPVALNIPCNIVPGMTGRFNVIAGVAWQTTITYSVKTGGNMVTANPQRFWKSQIAGVIDNFPTGAPNPVINTSPMGPNPITIPSPLGLTIFAQ